LLLLLSLINPIPAKFAPISPTLDVEAMDVRGLADRLGFLLDPGTDLA